mmetsp:Transcript_7562/g.9837  ORF Transcript_7562/g.9837 Transcript_7562/m.9837 type:complete len:704 (-) Transcript_7562:196-2307(-)
MNTKKESDSQGVGELPTQCNEDFTQATQLDGEDFMSPAPASPPMRKLPPEQQWGRLQSLSGQMIPLMPRGPTSDGGGKFNLYKLGRGSKNDFISSDKRVSTNHCSIYCMRPNPSGPLEVFIEDSSSNGTWINGSIRLRKDKRLLNTGDDICLLNPDPPKCPDREQYEKDIQANSLNFVNLSGRGLKKAKTLFRTQTGSVDRSRQLDDFFVRREMLGTGTSGKVYRVIERKTGMEYAVKVIETKKFRLTPGLSKEELIQEALMMKQISHPYIVNLKDLFQTDDEIHLVMDLVKGGDLFDRVVDRQKFSEHTARECFYRILVAVQYLHSEGICHRDLKPENILMVSKESDIEIKITDFGLAKKAAREGLKTFCGTPQYFAPEVLKRRNTVMGTGRYGMEADMWSLGVILYILLSGTMPFNDDTLFHQIQTATFSFDDENFGNVSHDAKHLIRMLLNTDPKKRYSADQSLKHPWITGREDGMGINFSQHFSQGDSADAFPPPRTRSENTTYETDGGSESDSLARNDSEDSTRTPIKVPQATRGGRGRGRGRGRKDMVDYPPLAMGAAKENPNLKPAVNIRQLKDVANENTGSPDDIQDYSSDENGEEGRKKVVFMAPDHQTSGGRKRKAQQRRDGDGFPIPNGGAPLKDDEKLDLTKMKLPEKLADQEERKANKQAKLDSGQQKLTDWLAPSTENNRNKESKAKKL